MKHGITSKSTEPPRCAFTKSHGHRCRMLPANGTPYCLAHQPKPATLPDPHELVRAELAEAAGTLSTPAEIHRLQAQVTLLLIHGRIAPKLANSYSYQVLALLRGCREIAHHEKLHAERVEREAAEARRDHALSWSLPRPERDGPTDPPPDTTGTSAVTSEPSEISISSAPLNAPAAPEPSHSTTTSAGSSTSLISPISFASSAPKPAAAITPPLPPKPLPPDFYNHFHPLDPSLPPGLQDHSKNIPPPDEAECRRLARRRGLDFSRRRTSQPAPRW